MLNKKGINYVDWVISMGTFLIIVIALFAYLQPTAQPPYKEENLLSLLEVKFMESTRSSVYKIPVFVHTLEKEYNLGSGTFDVVAEFPYAAGWSVTHVNPIPSALVVAPQVSQYTIKCLISPSCVDKVVFFYLTPPASFSNHNIHLVCVPNPSYCLIDVGATEILEGISPSLLVQLKTQGYAAVKQQWRYPEGKEFAITVDGNALFSGPEPGTRQNVQAKTFYSWYLLSNGQRNVTEVQLRVW